MFTIALLQATSSSPGAQSAMFNILLFGGLGLIFYFFIIAPQSKARKKTEEMLNSLKKGDRVVTTGGIYGTVQGVEADVVYLKIAENVKVKVARSAVSGLLSGDAAE
jgi:preprotein translocase subunit YajC